jgi:hypothetical protein
MWEIFAWTSIFDNSKIKAHTTYPGQKISWREGVKRTVTWMEANGRITNSDEDYTEDTLIANWRQAMAHLQTLR